MKRYNRSISVLLFSVMSVLTLWAEPISEAAALQEARAFLAQRGRTDALLAPIQAAARGPRDSQQSDFYVFNVPGNAGFVIVSGDDRAVPVLGYADQGAIDMNNLPPALENLFRSYSADMAALDSAGVDRPNGTNKANRPNRVDGTNMSAEKLPILPLIQTHWDQDEPYNLFTPRVTVGNHVYPTPTGCLATAMAQIMYYYQWPQGPTQGIPAYTTQLLQILCDSLPPVVFDWDHMLLDYTPNADSVSAAAVSTLMRYVGQAVEMVYTVGNSGAYASFVPTTLPKYFDYDPEVYTTLRTDVSNQEWIDMLYGELSAGRPVMYAINCADGGHAVICDGYDTDDYFHLNFGWSGGSDGYYALSAILPQKQGTGGYSGVSSYGINHEALIGFQPNHGGQNRCKLQTEGIYLGVYDTIHTLVLHRDAFDSVFVDSLPCLSGVAYHAYTVPKTFDVALQAFDTTGNYVATIHEYRLEDFDYLMFYELFCYSIPASLPLGTYSLQFVCRLGGDSLWSPLINGERYPITAVVDSFDLTLYTEKPYPTDPKLIDMTLYGPHTVGSLDTLVARVVGTGIIENTVRLFANNEVVLDGTYLDIQAGDTVTITFYFKPPFVGDAVLRLGTFSPQWVADDGNDSILVHFSRNPLRPYSYYRADGDEIQVRVDNLVGDTLYGNAIHTTFTVFNTNPDSAYVTYLACAAWVWTPSVSGEGDTTWVMDAQASETYMAWVPAASNGQPGQVSVTVNNDEIAEQPGCRVCGHLGYFDVTLQAWVDLGFIGFDEQTDTIGRLFCGGYALSDALDNLTCQPDADTIDCRDACYVDLRVANLSQAVIRPSSNPNCCYALAADAVLPEALAGRNIVQLYAADSVHLTDGYEFNPHNHFFAYHVDLTLHVRPTEAVVVPFAPDVLPEGMSLRYIFAEDYGTVAFTDPSEVDLLYDFTPCLMTTAVDPASSDSVVTVTLSANSTYLYASGDFIPMFDFDYYSFLGAFKYLHYDQAYFLSDDATCFLRAEPAVIPPFRAAIVGNLISTSRQPSVLIEGQGPTTDLTPADATVRPEEVPVKVLQDEQMLILHPNGAVFDAIGRKVK